MRPCINCIDPEYCCIDLCSCLIESLKDQVKSESIYNTEGSELNDELSPLKGEQDFISQIRKSELHANLPKKSK